MSASKVYFADMRATGNENIPKKLSRLIKTAGIDKINFKNKYTAIKIHFGEPGNLAYLRPNYAKVVVDTVKELGGKVFLTDCNTLYTGRRKNALDHLDSAYENGFSPFSTGCQIIIADGLKGTDEAYVDIDCEYIKTAKIGRALMDADIVISLNHFKGHEGAGFGGAMKNLGMGGGSRAGKCEMHSAGKPVVAADECIGCKACQKACAHSAISYTPEKIACIDERYCVGCDRCMGVCPVNALKPPSDDSFNVLNRKIAEYTYAVIKDRPHFHISIVIDISPFCDCHSENDVPIVPNIGMFASFDPVALDMACIDAVNAMPVNPGSRLAEMPKKHADHLTNSQPSTDWRSAIEHAEKLKLGTREYELIKI